MIARVATTQRGHLQKQESWSIPHKPPIRSKSPGSLFIHHNIILNATQKIMNSIATLKTTLTVFSYVIRSAPTACSEIQVMLMMQAYLQVSMRQGVLTSPPSTPAPIERLPFLGWSPQLHKHAAPVLVVPDETDALH